MSQSPIEWTDVTWNPTTGCDRTSPGCDNCYALRMSKRLKFMGSPKYQTDGDPRTSGPGFGISCHPETLAQPRTWTGHRTVFVDSMSDLFHPGVPESFIKQVFEVMVSTPQHEYQILTKRSRRLTDLAPGLPWPRNVWIGVSVESDRYLFRLDHLRRVPAAIRFVSAEPLLGPIAPNLEGIDWLIAGGESGPGARPVHEDWLRDLRDSCADQAVEFFFKQWGGRFPKAGGRTLDGRVWSDMPERVQAVDIGLNQ